MSAFTKTPRFVLMQDRNPIGPKTLPEDGGQAITTIFGFSSKLRYDEFLRENTNPLTPFPLVQRFMQRELEQNATALMLVVLDAASPVQDVVSAATFQAILDALGQNKETVELTHELTLDKATQLYRVQVLVS